MLKNIPNKLGDEEVMKFIEEVSFFFPSSLFFFFFSERELIERPSRAGRRSMLGCRLRASGLEDGIERRLW